VMTSLVQHLHAFAREAKLTEAEWAAGLDFIAECGRTQELVLLSDALGLSTLVAALERRRGRGSTESDSDAQPCFVRGRVRATDGRAVSGAEVRVWPSGVDGSASVLHSNAEGAFLVRCAEAQPQPAPHDGPVGRLQAALGRHPWRPAHLHFMISAPGHEPLATHVFRKGSQWVHHAPGRTPDGRDSPVAFCTLDFDFVLHPQTRAAQAPT